MNQRQKALEWWRELTNKEQFAIWQEHSPSGWSLAMFSTSSSTIERAYKKKQEGVLRQTFRNNSDCYADTWRFTGKEMEEGEVVQAMTEDKFIEVLRELGIL